MCWGTLGGSGLDQRCFCLAISWGIIWAFIRHCFGRSPIDPGITFQHVWFFFWIACTPSCHVEGWGWSSGRISNDMRIPFQTVSWMACAFAWASAVAASPCDFHFVVVKVQRPLISCWWVGHPLTWREKFQSWLSWSLGSKVSWFLGFEDSWFQRCLISWFVKFLVSKFLVSLALKFRVSNFQWSHLTKIQFNAFWKLLIPYSRLSGKFKRDLHDCSVLVFSNNFNCLMANILRFVIISLANKDLRSSWIGQNVLVSPKIKTICVWEPGTRPEKAEIMGMMGFGSLPETNRKIFNPRWGRIILRRSGLV